MSLNLSDIMKKAENKGIKPIQNKTTTTPLLRPWQQESVLFNQTNDQKTDKNPKQTGNEPATNRQQTDNKLTTNWKQTDNKTIEKKEHKPETGNKLETQPATHSATNRQQTDNKLTTKHVFSSLVGLQRAIIIILYNECKINRSKITENLTLEHLNVFLKTSIGSVKTTIQRLEKKNLIQRVEYKNGRGGWSKYALPDYLYQEVLNNETGNKPETNWQQTGNKLVAQPITQPATSPLSSSSNIILNKNTITTIPDEWKNINTKPLENIGLSETHLNQLYKTNQCVPNIIQESIFHFSYGLENNQKIKKYSDPLNVLMGVLRKGQAWIESNYESPQVIAQRQLLEQKKKEKEYLDKLQEEAFKIAFNEWKNKKDKKELESIGGEPEIINKIMVTPEDKIKNYFKKNIWETVKKEYLIKED